MSTGLDIGSRTIKAVELSKEKNSISLKSAGVVGYSGLELEKVNDKRELAKVADIIRKLFKDTKISSKKVAIALPEPQVFTRLIKLPLLTDQEIASAIKWEAEQYIPIPANEAIIQHQIIERRENLTPPVVLVLLVAAPRVIVEKYVKVATMAGLNVEVAETELIALSRVYGQAEQTVVVVDSGARSTDLAIIKGGNLIFSRSIPTAGVAFSRAVARALGVSDSQAEEYKKTYGFISNQLEGKVATALDPVFQIVVEEIRKAVHFYNSEERGDVPSLMVLSGGLSGMPEVQARLAKLLNMEVVIGNPFGNIKVDPNMQKNLTAYAPLYSVAVGLAMWGS